MLANLLIHPFDQSQHQTPAAEREMNERIAVCNNRCAEFAINLGRSIDRAEVNLRAARLRQLGNREWPLLNATASLITIASQFKTNHLVNQNDAAQRLRVKHMTNAPRNSEVTIAERVSYLISAALETNATAIEIANEDGEGK